MKIVIDLTSLSYHMSGIERYASCMSEEMLKADPKNNYVLIFRDEVYPAFADFIDGNRIRAVVLHGNRKVLFLQFVLPFHLNKIVADKFIFFAFTSPLFFRKKGIVNTIHDMGAWDSAYSMSFFQKLYWRITYRVSAKRSERILTVSNFSKGRICEILKIPKDKVNVIYPGVYEGMKKENCYTFLDIQDKYNLPKKYIMTLSTLEPRKNMELLLKAFAAVQDIVDYDLVLVGRKGWKMDEVLDKYGDQKRIHMTGFVEDDHISIIYKNALCFVFPSLYEGFGLPPVEALSLGTPVIASDASSIPEILREQVVYFESKNQQALEYLLLYVEKSVASMPCGLDEHQKDNYRFEKSAKRLLSILKR